MTATGALSGSSVQTAQIKVGVTAANEIDTVAGNLTLDSAGGTVIVDDALQVASTIGVSGDADLMTLADKSVTVSGNVTVNMADTSTGIVLAANQLSSSFVSGTFGAHFGSGFNNVAPTIGIGRTANAGQAIIDATAVGAGAFSGTPTNLIGLSPTSIEMFKRLGVTGTLGVVGAVTQNNGAITMLANGASSIQTAAGNLTLDSAAALNLGTSNATTITLGNAGTAVAAEQVASFTLPAYHQNRLSAAWAGANNLAMTSDEGNASGQIRTATEIVISGSNAAVYKAGSEEVYLNGLLLRSGSGNDYTVATTGSLGAGLKLRVVTLASSLVSGDVVQVKVVKFKA